MMEVGSDQSEVGTGGGGYWGGGGGGYWGGGGTGGRVGRVGGYQGGGGQELRGSKAVSRDLISETLY